MIFQSKLNKIRLHQTIHFNWFAEQFPVTTKTFTDRIHSLNHWTWEEWISVMTERFTDLIHWTENERISVMAVRLTDPNNDSVYGKWVNLSHDQKVH